MSMAPFTRVQMDRSIALAKAAGLRDYRRGAWWPDLAQCVVEYVHLMEDGTEIAPTSESFADEADVVSIATRANIDAVDRHLYPHHFAKRVRTRKKQYPIERSPTLAEVLAVEVPVGGPST